VRVEAQVEVASRDWLQVDVNRKECGISGCPSSLACLLVCLLACLCAGCTPFLRTFLGRLAPQVMQVMSNQANHPSHASHETYNAFVSQIVSAMQQATYMHLTWYCDHYNQHATSTTYESTSIRSCL
jgi:hypothetical protein